MPLNTPQYLAVISVTSHYTCVAIIASDWQWVVDRVCPRLIWWKTILYDNTAVVNSPAEVNIMLVNVFTDVAARWRRAARRAARVTKQHCRHETRGGYCSEIPLRSFQGNHFLCGSLFSLCLTWIVVFSYIKVLRTLFWHSKADEKGCPTADIPISVARPCLESGLHDETFALTLTIGCYLRVCGMLLFVAVFFSAIQPETDCIPV